MDVGAAFVADEQALEVVQPSEGALDDPAIAPEAGAVRGSAAGDLGGDPALTQRATLRSVVVRAIGRDPVRSAPRPAGTATHRRHPIDQRHQLGYVVAVAARECPREWDPGRVDEEVMLGAVSGSINRARARRGAPFFACT